MGSGLPGEARGVEMRRGGVEDCQREVEESLEVERPQTILGGHEVTEGSVDGPRNLLKIDNMK